MKTIDPATFSFLHDLALNNNREWFAANKEKYEVARKNVEDVAADLLVELQSFDDRIPKDILPKKCVLRIYRDVRFSKIKTPYKTNFGVSVSEAGRGADCPGYYIHFEPGKSFVAGGYWLPQAEHLKSIRQEIDYNTSDLLNIIESQDFKNYFKALSTEDSLKFAPKGYDIAHQHIGLLKLKSFICSRSFTDKELQKQEGLEKMVEGLKLIMPLNHFLKNALV